VIEKRKLPTAKSTFQLRISIQETDPEVWRRVLVPGTIPLDKLHDVIQDVFGWWDYHLHAFNIGVSRFGLPDVDGFEDEEQDIDEHGVKLHSLVGEGDQFTYEYDFGDFWVHDVKVESVEYVVDSVESEALTLRRAVCIDGANARPPEDCGGTGGFEEFKTVMANPRHEEHESMAVWSGGPFDSERFSLAEANAMLQRPR
jgi:hypothetical protein